jgi:nitric oxide reductase subunit B
MLPAERQARLRGRLESRMRLNTYDPNTRTITLDADRAAAISGVADHYERLFGNDPAGATLREAYAMKNDTVPDAGYRHSLTAFFWWTAWAAATNRPGAEITYTNNWPGEPLIGNRPPASTYLWSAFSVLFLIAGIALLGWHHAVTHGRSEEPARLPATDPLAMVRITPSMRATAKYFWVVLALFLVQILLRSCTIGLPSRSCCSSYTSCLAATRSGARGRRGAASRPGLALWRYIRNHHLHRPRTPSSGLPERALARHPPSG